MADQQVAFDEVHVGLDAVKAAGESVKEGSLVLVIVMGVSVPQERN
jgi:hypothetical protein